MRLLTLTVRNYRVHRDLTVTFDASRNLIGGPNESGKSTLAEAIHRALFLRAKTGGNLRQEMISTRHLGDPEIVLTFEACDSRWELEKRFAGTKGSARLTDSKGTIHRDDEAEMKLAEILKCDTNGGRSSAGQLPLLWSHLWVWQGKSGDDPSSHATQHKDTLVQRLQHDGLAAVMQSATDQQVRERVDAAYHELFTSTGKPKAGSIPELARNQLAEAEIALERGHEIASRLEQAAADHERAAKELSEIDSTLPHLREQRTAAENKLTEVTQLRSQEATRLQAWETAATVRKQLAENDNAIRRLNDQAIAAKEALAPAERLEMELVAQENQAAGLSQHAEISQREAADTVRLIRLRHDLAAASISAFEKAAEHQRLTDRQQEASDLRREIASHHEALAKLPNITTKDLETLRQLDRTASQAGASLNAMATGIELLAANGTVTLDGQPLAPGEVRTLTDAGELAVGTHTRLRIRPGGGTSLADARALHETTQRNLTTALDRHTLSDLDHAALILQQRQTLSQQIVQLETRWKALGGDSLATELATATAAHEAAKSEVERRLAATHATASPPENLATARQLRTGLQHDLEHAEKAETTTRDQAAHLRQRLEITASQLRTHREQTGQARQSLRDLETKFQVLQETHGDPATRDAALIAAHANEQKTADQLAATRQQLAALAPELLTADLDRFSRAIQQQELRRRDAETRGVVARDRLTLDGSIDPHAELAHAQARHAAALEMHASGQRRAKAIEQLHQLFSSSREAIDRSIVQPLADRISGYLQCLFGPAAEVRVTLSDTGIEGLELIRPGDPNFSFQTLSGGAKEQVAAAVRLAMAEILAADHDTCLPILFDDAFAYTDPIRVQALQRMLDLAATRGLQIIILTCTPNDYSAFGASEHRLTE